MYLVLYIEPKSKVRWGTVHRALRKRSKVAFTEGTIAQFSTTGGCSLQQKDFGHFQIFSLLLKRRIVHFCLHAEIPPVFFFSTQRPFRNSRNSRPHKGQRNINNAARISCFLYGGESPPCHILPQSFIQSTAPMEKAVSAKVIYGHIAQLHQRTGGRKKATQCSQPCGHVVRPIDKLILFVFCLWPPTRK